MMMAARLRRSLWTEGLIAVRFLGDNIMQTVLIIIGIAVGAAVIVFITALITGLQVNIIDRTLGTQAHIRLLPLDEANRILPGSPGTLDLVLESPRSQRLRSIGNWQALRDLLDQDTRVRAVSPVISGPGQAHRGVARASATLVGIDPPRYQRIIPLGEDLIAGTLRVDGGHAVIGSELAEDLGIAVGDKLILEGGDGRTAVVRAAGLFELGVRELDTRYVYLDLKQAQTLLDLPGGVTVIDTTIADIFSAERLAGELARLTGLKAESWMTTNGQLLNALRSQSMTTEMIRVFVGVSVAFGIASVLAVSVVQRTREIGILRAMGSPPRAGPAHLPSPGRAARSRGLLFGRRHRLEPGAGLQPVRPRALSYPRGAQAAARGHGRRDRHRRAGRGPAGTPGGPTGPRRGDSPCLSR